MLKAIDIAKARDDAAVVARQALELSENVIAPFLAGKSPELQGATLANLLAIWLAGHHPATRGMLLQMHMASVLDLVKIEAAKRGE